MSESPWIVETEGLTRRFGRFVAVDHVDLRVPRHSIFGFVGPSGCGKTTTIRILCGLLAPTSGRAIVNGCDVAHDPEAVRQNLGYMAQKFSLYPDMTVRENLEFYGGVYGLGGDDLEAAIAGVLHQLGLGPRQEELTADLPLGWKQRVALGAAILHNPPVLFLDEPTSGVDPASRRLFWSLLDRLSAGGTSIFVTTHTMEEAERCDRVAIMYAGRVVAADTPRALKASFQGNLYKFDVEPLLQALEAARRLPNVMDAVMFGTALHLSMAAADPEGLKQALQEQGVRVYDIHPILPTLEDVFVQQIPRGERKGER
jgi:ABC-2 type transport system ATP-binding protein